MRMMKTDDSEAGSGPCPACCGSGLEKRGRGGSISFRVMEPGGPDEFGGDWEGDPCMQAIARFTDSISGVEAVCFAVPVKRCPFCGRTLAERVGP